MTARLTASVNLTLAAQLTNANPYPIFVRLAKGPIQNLGNSNRLLREALMGPHDWVRMILAGFPMQTKKLDN